MLTGLWLLFTGILPAHVTAQTPEPAPAPVVVERVEVGFADYYKVAEWTPVRITVLCSSPQTVSLVVEAPDSDGNPTAIPGARQELPAGASRTIESCFRTGRLQGELFLRLLDEQGHVLWQRRSRASAAEGSEFRPALRHDVPLMLSLAELPDLRSSDAASKAQPSLFAASTASTGFDPRVIRLEGLGDLPTSVRALESVAAIFLPTARRSSGASALDGLTPARAELLRDWVRDGGHLVISVAAEEAAYRASPLAAWVPAAVEGGGTLRQLPDLERYADINAPLRFSGSIRTARVASLPARNVLVKEGSVPLIAVVPFGFGRVTVIALDIESPPLSTWTALPTVLRKLVGGPVTAARKVSPQSNRQLTQTGVTDLATQLQSAQEDFQSVARPSHWWVMGLLIAYLIVIGPLDYFIVNRWLKRPELTWLTFGALVCLGAGAAAWGANRINGESVLSNQLDLVDFDATTRTIRGRSWISLYSPENRRYAIAVQPVGRSAESPGTSGGEDRRATLTWSGIPENAVGGVYRSGGAGFGGQPYQFDVDSHAAENLPILQWSTKSLVSSWSGDTDRDLVEAQLESAGAGLLAGTITHHLPEPLEDCVFIVGGWAYFPAGERARIAPGVPWEPGGRQSKARDLKALLTGERRTRKEGKDSHHSEVLTTTVAYNPLSQNRVDLVNMLSFHQVAGGAEYTGLNHAALRQLELTQLMQLGRGVLIGRRKAPAAQATIDGQALSPGETDSFVRLIIPVQFSDRGPTTTMPRPFEPIPSASPK